MGPEIATATGLSSAPEIGISMATLGLACASLIGGPIAKRLIDRNALEGEHNVDPVMGLEFEKEGDPDDAVNHISLMRALLVAHIAILLGYFVHQSSGNSLAVKLPLFVPCLLVPIVMSNTVPFIMHKMIWPTGSRALAVLSGHSLSAFLAMSLMSMQLWTLGERLFGRAFHANRGDSKLDSVCCVPRNRADVYCGVPQFGLCRF